MRRPENIDRLLIGVLLPVWLVCFGLHVREVARTGIAMPPVFASPQGADAYPTVGGFHLERPSEGTGLRVGDRLIRAGNADLRGVGAIRFRALAVEHAGPDGTVPLRVERDGRPLEVALALRPFPVPWFRIPVVLGLVLIALLVLLNARPTASNRLAFLGVMVLAIAQSPFPGSSYLQTLVAWPFFYLGNPLGIAILCRWAISFPERVPDAKRPPALLAYAMGLVSLLPRISYPLGGPVPSELIPVVEHGTDGLFFLTLLGIFLWNHRHADAAGRRALRWFLYGYAIPAVPIALLLLVPLAFPDFEAFELMLGLLGAFGAVGLAGLLIAITRYRLFDIDRLISATATYSIVLVLLLAGGAAIVPALARSASAYSGVGEQAAQVLLCLALAGLAVPAYRRLRPGIERVFFPEREALERGTRQLRADIEDCASDEEVWQLVDARIEALLRCERCVTFVRDATGFAVSPHEGPSDLRLPADDPLLAHLAAHPAPLAVEESGPGTGFPAPAGPARAALEALNARLLIPLRRGKDLAAFLCLGPKRSGDVYGATDQALLGTIVESASARLRELRDARVIERERTNAAQMRALKDAAEQANLAKSRFLAAASHDLRQPLHALGLFVDALEQQVKEGAARPLVERVGRSTRSLTEMFDALLDISRLDAGAVSPDVADVELFGLLERLTDELGVQARAKGIELRTVASRAVVRTDPVLFGRIVQNLLTNAIRYTESGRVLLGVRRRGDALRVEVWDTGPGIPESRLREIFQEFVQLEGARGGGGLGLGLSIVDRLARLLGHELDVRSTPGRGSVFAVTVPRSRGVLPAAAQAEAEAGPRATGLQDRRILLVDDEPEILSAVTQLLERWGCRVLPARSGREALERLGQLDGPLDAVLADYRLDGTETGLDVVAAIRERASRAVPAAVITGEGSAAPLEAIRAAGLPLLRKPVRPARLRAILEQVLR